MQNEREHTGVASWCEAPEEARSAGGFFQDASARADFAMAPDLRAAIAMTGRDMEDQAQP
jgi:hypothetical protein